ncbi:MAG: M48 family metalloprotease [Pseudanabaenaceae cyanobacterium]
MSLKAGKEALLRKHYAEAIALLHEYCADHPDPTAKDYVQAQIWLVSAYKKTGRADKSITICENLQGYVDPQLQEWAAKSIVSLRRSLASPQKVEAFRNVIEANADVESLAPSQSRRYHKRPVTVAMPEGDQYWLIAAMAITLLTLMGLILVGWIGLVSLVSVNLTDRWWTVVGWGTLLISMVLFFMSPWLIDITQRQYQRTQWITLADLEPKSAEAVAMIEEFCEKHQMDVPRLGLIDDDTPVIFTYGVLRNSVRIVASRGLLKLLDEDEIAAVYGYQLGQIYYRTYGILTFGSAPIQILYWIYVTFSRLSYRAKFAKEFWQGAAMLSNLFYRLSTYLLFFLSRRSAYGCDHFATSLTGNPNAVSRALTKIARGLLPYTKAGSLGQSLLSPPSQNPNRLLESSRAIGFCDYSTTMATGIAFNIMYSGQCTKNMYEVFLWELGNPWASWLQCHSSHPLLAKRMSTLANYCKQLGLQTEYDFAGLIKQSQRLDKTKLYRNFGRDWLIQVSPFLGLVLGLGGAVALEWLYNRWLVWSLSMIGLGLGWMLQGSLRYPDFRRVSDTDLVTLLLDPYASFVKGLPVQIAGELLNYNSDAWAGYVLQIEDQGGMMYLHYLPDPKQLLIDPLPTLEKMERLVDQSVLVTGWFRHGNLPMIDVSTVQPILTEELLARSSLNSQHQFWNNLTSSLLVMAGVLLLLLTGRLW